MSITQSPTKAKPAYLTTDQHNRLQEGPFAEQVDGDGLHYTFSVVHGGNRNVGVRLRAEGIMTRIFDCALMDETAGSGISLRDYERIKDTCESVLKATYLGSK